MDLKERHEIRNLTRHPWEMSRCRVVVDLLKDLLAEGTHVLDIGCGDLFVEEYLLKDRSDCFFYCVDTAYSDQEVEALKGKYTQVKVYNTFEAFMKENIQIDVILLLDVVEHIKDDCGFLRDLMNHSCMTLNTRVLITVPAFQCLFSSHDHFLGHYRRYNMKKLSTLLREAGLENCECGYFYSILLLPRFFQKLKEYMIGVGDETTDLVEWKGGRKLTLFLCWIFTMDYRMNRVLNRIGVKLPGLSNYVICRKERV
ncbi:MAG: class I SAM-dependent methyltransferase [Odoribacter sp.]